MYARGMSTREIVGHLRDLYGIDVSPDLISAVADAVLEEVSAWQARPLEAIYPPVFLYALRVKIRDEGLVRNTAIHIALGVRADGIKEILGLWLEQNDRRGYLAISCGSNLAWRSRGTASSIWPVSVMTVFLPWPFRRLPGSSPAR
jgi:transposase-like protein